MVRIVVAVFVMLLAHHASAEAKCKQKGKVLLRVEQAPLPGFEDSVPNAQLRIFATGAWSRVQEMPDGQEPSSQSGCLSKAHLKELKRTLARAKFELDTTGMGTCKAISMIEKTYASPKRKQQVTTASPCGTPMDTGTDNLAACGELATSAKGMTAAEIRAVCRGEPDLEGGEER